jgi:hypothetical protein
LAFAPSAAPLPLFLLAFLLPRLPFRKFPLDALVGEEFADFRQQPPRQNFDFVLRGFCPLVVRTYAFFLPCVFVVAVFAFPFFSLSVVCLFCRLSSVGGANA